jgi:restriction system protein
LFAMNSLWGHRVPGDSIWLHNGRVPANDRTRKLPSHVAMTWPTLCAIKRAAGSASNAEILEAVAVDLKLTAEQRAVLRGSRGSRTLLEYRLAWARTFLKQMGAIASDAPCQWSITEIGQETTPEDIENFKKRMLDTLAEYNRNKQASADPS